MLGTTSTTKDMFREISEASSIPFPYSKSQFEELKKLFSLYPSLLTTKKYSDMVSQMYQRVLFNWHCFFFYDISTSLILSEREYIEAFFRLHGDENRAMHLLGTVEGNRMSSYSYR